VGAGCPPPPAAGAGLARPLPAGLAAPRLGGRPDTWALVVPQAIAYSQIAQLPPQAGLFAAFGGLLRGALRS